ncbi:META domain-containing protein [Dehalogenimonas alkenigignens]|uniref:Heat shock protein n=1 Tax=Dehalogenimonas alkenigignens TaxID=1217799 RepID=A0A0W0GIX2_9CHLR|nr:META domain-containing protein [Dehalogenimonas alkenigignens]KTB48472.1 Heat shock protein [Dehalogenimonas alkenigignens]PVV85077.1 META domain-containing protein [Dehalogenimonas alkenigignens]
MKKNAAILAAGLVLIIFLVSASACADRYPPGAEVPLKGTIWVLEEFGDPGKLNSPISGTRITIRFDPDGKQVGGSSGCNTYGGGYVLSGQHGLDVKDIIQTEIACGGGINAQEAAYFNILIAVTSFDLEHRRLTLSGPRGILVFEP